MNGVLGQDSALLRLYWAEDNLGECDEFCYESWRSIDRSTCWPAVQHATTVSRMPSVREKIKIQNNIITYKNIYKCCIDAASLKDVLTPFVINWYCSFMIKCD